MANQPANMEIDKGDLVVLAAAVLALLIVGVSVYWLWNAEVIAGYQKEKFEACKAIFQLVVKDTLLTLFTTIVGLKVGFVAARAFAARLGN